MCSKGSNPFVLSTVAARVSGLEQGARIETMELSAGSLYLGTSDGTILHYGLSERRQDNLTTVLEANFINSKTLADRNKISLIHAAPAINTVLVLCNSNLLLLSITDDGDLAAKNLPGHQKLRGINCCSIDSSHCEPDRQLTQARFCLTRKKQVFIFSIDEEKVTLERSGECGEPVMSACLSGRLVCAALPSQYVILNMEGGSSTSLQQLFAIHDPASASLPITRIGAEEFLVTGPGNLGIFVTAGGTSHRPPIQWTYSISKIVYSAPYLIGLSPELVAVYSVTDQRLKQTVPFPGGRHVGCFDDGTILLASSNQVASLLPVPWQLQVDTLLQGEHVEEALQLVESVLTGPPPSATVREEVAVVRQRAAFLYLGRGELSLARDLLLLSHPDPREVISLFPGMLSADSKFVRRSPPLHNLPDITAVAASAEGHNSNNSKEEFLLTYLQQYLDREEHNYPEYLEEVYTALTKMMGLLRPARFPAFIDQGNLVLNYADLVDFFTTRNLHHFTALLHAKFLQMGRACAVWSHLVRKELQDAQGFPGLEYFCQQLAGLRVEEEELLWTHADTCLEREQQTAVQIFISRGDSSSSFMEQALTLLNKYPIARQLFLEYLVFDAKSEKENIHTLLALTLIDGWETQENCDKLRQLILSSPCLNSQFLLSKLEGTCLHYERAILHGRLREYDRALDILVHSLADFRLAEQFCDDISKDQDGDVLARLLFLLLATYLHPKEEADRDLLTVQAVDLMNKRAGSLQGSQVLRLIPDSWNIATILPALRIFVRQTAHTERMTAITKHLSKGENVAVRRELRELTTEPILLMPTNYCITCKKKLAVGEVARFPNGVLVHNSCVVNPSICPLTGTVFKLLH